MKVQSKISIYKAKDIEKDKVWVGLYIGTSPNDDTLHYLGTGYGNGQHEIEIDTLEEIERVYPFQFEDILKKLQHKFYGIDKK